MCKLTKEEEYSIISRTMTNIRSLRTYVRELDFEQLLDMQKKLDKVIKERHEDAEREAAERKKLEAKYQQAVEYITSLGLDPEVCLIPVSAIAETTETKRKPKGGVRKAKYIFEDENGDTKTWSGNGKMPLALRQQINGDCPLETFLIEKPNQHGQSEQSE
ncbi:H-NS histone family protein [Escherichia coli]|nr:H-NS histone family protein [Escherichia coli]